MTVKVPSRVDPEQLAGVRQCRISGESARWPGPLGQAVQRGTPSPLHIDQERTTCGDDSVAVDDSGVNDTILPSAGR